MIGNRSRRIIVQGVCRSKKIIVQGVSCSKRWETKVVLSCRKRIWLCWPEMLIWTRTRCITYHHDGCHKQLSIWWRYVVSLGMVYGLMRQNPKLFNNKYNSVLWQSRSYFEVKSVMMQAWNCWCSLTQIPIVLHKVLAPRMRKFTNWGTSSNLTMSHCQTLRGYSCRCVNIMPSLWRQATHGRPTLRRQNFAKSCRCCIFGEKN